MFSLDTSCKCPAGSLLQSAAGDAGNIIGDLTHTQSAHASMCRKESPSFFDQAVVDDDLDMAEKPVPSCQAMRVPNTRGGLCSKTNEHAQTTPKVLSLSPKQRLFGRVHAVSVGIFNVSRKFFPRWPVPASISTQDNAEHNAERRQLAAFLLSGAIVKKLSGPFNAVPFLACYVVSVGTCGTEPKKQLHWKVKANDVSEAGGV